jgi:ATP-dependent helicase/nuclease subunit A
MELSIHRSDAAQGQIVGHGSAARGGGIGRGSGTGFRPAGDCGQKSEKRKLSAAETGTAHHKFLQHFALENAGGIAALETETRRLEREKVLSADERAVLDLDALAAFLGFAAGQKNPRATADSVKRELPFTAKFSPAELAEITGAEAEAGLENEFVVVQGVADLVVLLPEEIWLVDFKTDEVRADELPERTRLYEPQLKLYARALVENLFAAGR